MDTKRPIDARILYVDGFQKIVHCECWNCCFQVEKECEVGIRFYDVVGKKDERRGDERR